MNNKNKLLREIIPIAALVLIAVGLVLALLLVRSGEDPEAQSHVYYGAYCKEHGTVEGYFNTACSVYDYSGLKKEDFESFAHDVESALVYYHKLFDIYHEYDGVVNIATLNRLAGTGPIKVSADLIDFLQFCLYASEVTDGEVSVTMGAVLEIWHDHRESGLADPIRASVPDDDALCEAAAHVNSSVLLIDRANCTVEITDPAASLDPGAIGKGYAAEVIAKNLVAKGYDSLVLDFGGNLKMVGSKPSGKGWRTGIKNPSYYAEDPYVKYLDIKNTSLVTSGDYERYYVVEGKKYHHIIDPDTLMPSEHFASVSILTENSGLADALSTALFCMSMEDGMRVIENLRGSGVEARVIWVTHDGEVYDSAGD